MEKYGRTRKEQKVDHARTYSIMKTKVSQQAIDAFHHKPFCCSESTHKENKNIPQGGKKYGDV